MIRVELHGLVTKYRRLQVYSIREAATSNLAKLAREFGPDWARDHLVPQVTLTFHMEACLQAVKCTTPCSNFLNVLDILCASL